MAKDALGHGSNSRGGSNPLRMFWQGSGGIPVSGNRQAAAMLSQGPKSDPVPLHPSQGYAVQEQNPDGGWRTTQTHLNPTTAEKQAMNQRVDSRRYNTGKGGTLKTHVRVAGDMVAAFKRQQGSIAFHTKMGS